MKKFTIQFTYQDRTRRGLHFKTAKRTVKAKSYESAIRKIEQSFMDKVFNPVLVSEDNI